MTSAMGWYGPLIDLSRAASRIGDFVQLLVFVHRSTPVQYKLSGGGELIRTDIQVGDDTLPFFSISLWKKQMGTAFVAGDVILLQNVKITKFGQVIDARTVQFSSVIRLIHPYESIISRGVDELIEKCHVGMTSAQKLRKVIKWLQRTGPAAIYNVRSNTFQNGRLPRNWKVPKQCESRNLFLLSELVHLRDSCKATFSASVGEIFLPITWRILGDTEKENMFLSQRINTVGESNIAEDFICIGCQHCGSPLYSENEDKLKQNFASLYCPRSSNHFHVVGLVYRPFMLYVWDESEYLPLLVRNKAAELLFGNIRAERVYSCYRWQKHVENSEQKDPSRGSIPKSTAFGSFCADKNLPEDGNDLHKDVNFYLVWLIVLRLLLQQGKNSLLKFEVAVNSSLDNENGKFELSSVSISCMEKN
ncbi:hypothetical protein Tsubulata_022149 [Turnera subulata]|uniref:Uncharacterized protein n=1 Tax=Turnera subulata TaxID=218843 RepID=A0A9Q0F4J9_9ROSI|nr:hypothetical protein Tsubulata_022149 [Turnera subulata]